MKDLINSITTVFQGILDWATQLQNVDTIIPDTGVIIIVFRILVGILGIGGLTGLASFIRKKISH